MYARCPPRLRTAADLLPVHAGVGALLPIELVPTGTAVEEDIPGTAFDLVASFPAAGYEAHERVSIGDAGVTEEVEVIGRNAIGGVQYLCGVLHTRKLRALVRYRFAPVRLRGDQNRRAGSAPSGLAL